MVGNHFAIFKCDGEFLCLRAFPSQWFGNYDSDGKMDLLLTGDDGMVFTGRSDVWHNGGGDQFTESSPVIPGVSRGSAVRGDFDNDGRPDFLVAGKHNYYLVVIAIFRNPTRIIR